MIYVQYSFPLQSNKNDKFKKTIQISNLVLKESRLKSYAQIDRARTKFCYSGTKFLLKFYRLN